MIPPPQFYTSTFLLPRAKVTALSLSRLAPAVRSAPPPLRLGLARGQESEVGYISISVVMDVDAGVISEAWYHLL